MKQLSNNQTVFFELLRAGLWEKEARLSRYKDIDYPAIMKLAEEQSVVGLVTAGLEQVVDIKVPKEVVLQFVGSTLQIEQQNKAMNAFVAKLIDKLQKDDVYSILVKGQGIAQCYEKPLWRSCGDVDLLLDETNYEKAKSFLSPLASSVEEEDKDTLHLGLLIDGWVVELHGTLYSKLKKSINRELRIIQEDTFINNRVRVWKNGIDVYLPGADNDIIFVFAHIIQHLFKSGIGLRQVCDWCRLLSIYCPSLDIRLLEARIKRMGLLSEWKVFAALAVNYLGMSEMLMPFYDKEVTWLKKANRVMTHVFEVGNFGHNRDISFYNKYPYFIVKIISLGRHFSDLCRYASVFPLDTLYVSLITIREGLKAVKSGK